MNTMEKLERREHFKTAIRQAVLYGVLAALTLLVVGLMGRCSAAGNPRIARPQPGAFGSMTIPHGEIRLTVQGGLFSAESDGDALIILQPRRMTDSQGNPSEFALTEDAP